MRSRTSPKKARAVPVPAETTFQYTLPAEPSVERQIASHKRLEQIDKEDVMSLAQLQAKICREMPKPHYDLWSHLKQWGYSITDGGNLVWVHATHIPGNRVVPHVTIETFPLADYWTHQLTPTSPHTTRKAA